MMKRACCVFVLLTVLLARGGVNPCSRIIDVGTTKVVPFEDTVSPDGAYAIGWTAFVKQKDAAPIDWSKWSSDNIEEFFTSDGSIDVDGDFYGMTDGLIDLKDKKFLALASDEPEFPHKNRGFLFATWGPNVSGTRYAVVQNDARFSTENVWLIKIDAGGMHQSDLAGDLNEALEPILRAKRPVSSQEYETFFHDYEAGASADSVSFSGDTASFPFHSDIPKSLMATSGVEGKITIRLSDGSMVKVTSDSAVDDPFADNAELAKADGKLNTAYAKLAKSLDASDRAALKKEQLQWIDDRDEAASAALRNPPDDHADDPIAGRNEALLTKTNERLAELQKRLGR